MRPRHLGWLSAFALLVVGSGSAAEAALPVRLAVAPFSTQLPATAFDSGAPTERALRPAQGLRVAKVLTARLGLRDLDRLLSPGAFVAEAEFDPHAESVRRWAYNASVETVVVGRVSELVSEGFAGDMRIEAVVRSGHSGAELARHEVVLPGGAGLALAMEQLAGKILADLGHRDAPLSPPPPPPAAPGRAGSTSTGSSAGAGSSGRGLDADLGLEGFQEDAPIEIKADEAEIISGDEERLLVFQRNVLVRQANITLRSDRLEAVYRRGESEPRKLVAKGRVRVEQDGRHALCDQAIYLREAQRLSCVGHAELVQGCDTVRGESIEFDLAGDRARVEGAASIVIRQQDEATSACTPKGGRL